VDFHWIACGLAGAFSSYLFRALAGGTGYGRVADYVLGVATASVCPLFALSTGLVTLHRQQELPLAAYLASGLVLALARTYRSADPAAWFVRLLRR
jgi:hypothetical protein